MWNPAQPPGFLVRVGSWGYPLEVVCRGSISGLSELPDKRGGLRLAYLLNGTSRHDQRPAKP